MKHTTLQSILNDLYTLDPSFRDHEKELTALLSELIRNKPHVEIDERFVQTLRANLLRTSAEQQTTSSSFIFQLFSMKNMLIPVGGIAVALALGSVIYLSNTARTNMSLVSLPQFVTLESGAFGDLSQLDAGALGTQEARSAVDQAPSFGGGGIAGMNSSESIKMIAPAMMYKYVYTGEELSLEHSSLDVFRRVKSLTGADAMLRGAQGAAKELLAISKMNNAEMHSFVLNQSSKEGYMTTFDFAEGRVSINPNSSWYAETREYRPMTIGEVPADSAVIAIANRFMNDYGIDRANYGEPVVDSRWRDSLTAPETQGHTPWIPDMLTVTYPIIVEGEVVYETSGDPYGLRLTVDLRRGKVQSLWNLTSERYERSSYAVEQDAARILMVAENGGMYGGWYYGDAEVQELSLGTPDIVYIQQHRHDPKTNTNEELFVPAFRFPITGLTEEQSYMSRYVFVPLVKHILDEYRAPEQFPQPDGPIRILPFEEAVTSELKKVE